LLCLAWCGAAWAAAGDGDGQTIRYEYDELDRLVYVQTLSGETEYTYDKLGNRLGKTHHAAYSIIINVVGKGTATTSAAFHISDGKDLDYDGKDIMVLAEPDEGWKIESIVVTNKKDGTSVDVTEDQQFELTSGMSLTVTFSEMTEDDYVGLEAVRNESERLSIEYTKSDQALHISGVPANTYCVLYTTDGRMVNRTKSHDDGTARLRARDGELFILQVGKVVKKIFTK